jgi:hypothetical protein
MSTKITDIIIPEVFNPYVVEKTTQLSALIRSGIVYQDAELNRLASTGGTLLNMPFFKALTGADEVLTDSAALTPDKINSGKDVAVLLMRGKAWGVNDLAKALSGADPLAEIGNMVAEYWVEREQAILISILRGIFSTALADTHSHSVAVTTATTPGNENKINANAVIDASIKLGDAKDSLTAMIMHSVVYGNLEKNALINYETLDPITGSPIPTYLGRKVIVDDTCPVVNNTTTGQKEYITYLFGAGAIGRGEGNPPVPVETDRDSLAGEDVLIHRRHFILHPRGVKFTSTSMAGVTPTNDELANGANWAKVYSDKNIRIVQLITNG